MKETRITIVVAVVLALFAAAGITARVIFRPSQKLARGESLWRLKYDLTFAVTDLKARVRIFLPTSTTACELVRESLEQEGFALDVLQGKRAAGRVAVAVPQIGRIQARFQATVDLRLHPRKQRPVRSTLLLHAEDRARYLKPEEGIRTSGPQVTELLGRLTQGGRKKGEIVKRIFEYCSEELRHDASGSSPDDAVSVFGEGRGTALGCARAMVSLCRAAKIPARLVIGFVLERHGEARPRVWVEAYVGKTWMPYDPAHGYAERLPRTYLPVRRGGASLAGGTGVSVTRAAFTLNRIRTAAQQAADRTPSAWDVLDLERLPLGMRETLALLLLLPAGALITAFFRNVVGLQTFGTFTPSLLAMSFLFSDWRTGLFLFVLILLVGLVERAALERLRLLMVPRLSVVLTGVVVCAVLGVSILDYHGLTPSARAVILPLVILSMMIERFFIRSEEDGVRSSLKLLGGTLLVAGCCYLLLGWHRLAETAIRFPESVLAVAAGLLVVGRYSGYRLTELARFRDLARPDNRRRSPV